jgi:type I restriction enzyme, S subunit
VSELPKGWTHACLPELISQDGVFVDGDWVESKDQDQNGDVRLIQLADVGDGRYVDKSNRFLTKDTAIELGCTFLHSGDVLIARMPDPLGRACIFPGDRKHAVTVVDVCVVRGRQEHFDRSWLMHFINAAPFRADIHSLQSGSTRKRISRGNLSTLKLPVPPRPEQTRIVAKLEEVLSDLDAGVAELKAAQKKLAQYRQSLLKAAVEGALTAQWREEQQRPTETGAQLLQRILTERRARWEAKQLAKFKEQGKAPPKDWQTKYPEPVQPDTTNLPELPEGWVYASLDQLLLQLRSGSAESSLRGITEFPVLKSSAIRPGAIDYTALNYLTAAQSRVENYIKAGDLFISRLSGSVEYVGCCAQVGEASEKPIQYPDRLFCGKLVSHTAILGSHIVFCMSGPFARAKIEKAAKSTAGHKRISLSDLHPFPIPLPPLQEIQELARLVETALEQITQQESAITVTLKQSNAQRQNIRRAAFAGQLVPQDPNDEPASVLLARIRASRGARENQPKVRKTKQQKEIASVVSKIIDVLAESADWVPAQEAFRRCGVADGAVTDQVEAIYSELRALDKAGRLAVEPVTDTQGRKLHDRLKLLPG